MLTETAWEPPLDDPSPAAVTLVRGAREAIPAIVGHLLSHPTETTPVVTAQVSLDAKRGTASVRLKAWEARRVDLGPRDTLAFRFAGEAIVKERHIGLSGRCAIDLATSAILELRLETPVED